MALEVRQVIDHLALRAIGNLSSKVEQGVQSAVVIILFQTVAGIVYPSNSINQELVTIATGRWSFNLGAPNALNISREKWRFGIPVVEVTGESCTKVHSFD